MKTFADSLLFLTPSLSSNCPQKKTITKPQSTVQILQPVSCRHNLPNIYDYCRLIAISRAICWHLKSASEIVKRNLAIAQCGYGVPYADHQETAEHPAERINEHRPRDGFIAFGILRSDPDKAGIHVRKRKSIAI